MPNNDISNKQGNLILLEWAGVVLAIFFALLLASFASSYIDKFIHLLF